MKRRRGGKSGSKKAKKIKEPASALVGVNTEDNHSAVEVNDDKVDSEIDMETSSIEPEKLKNVSDTNSELPHKVSKPTVSYSRVKVKLKSSKGLQPHKNHVDDQTPSDANKSHREAGFQVPDASIRKQEDNSTYSDGHSSAMQLSGKSPKKFGSIKIKSSRVPLIFSEANLDTDTTKPNAPSANQNEVGASSSDNEILVNSLLRKFRHKEAAPSYRNEEELKASLDVVERVMKMEAAEPFNTPVDPVALGIPDYFDIIDTPMDFGTIRQELEHGTKYMNSKDVYEDVQFIWENCDRYNSKGTYILGLMKRVKKNFMKYWTAAGLYVGEASNEAAPIDDDTQPGEQKLQKKSKYKHKRRGTDSHKSDCLCAVCVMRRRRRERENSTGIEVHIATNGAEHPHEQKESSPLDNPCSEDASSSTDQSAGNNDNQEQEAEGEEKFDNPQKHDSGLSRKHVTGNGVAAEPKTRDGNLLSLHPPIENGDEYSGQQSQEEEMDLHLPPQHGEQKTMSLQELEREGGSKEMLQCIEPQEPLEENHLILQICSRLFPRSSKSVWNGPNSLNKQQVPPRDSPIHSAIATLLKR